MTPTPQQAIADLLAGMSGAQRARFARLHGHCPGRRAPRTALDANRLADTIVRVVRSEVGALDRRRREAEQRQRAEAQARAERQREARIDSAKVEFIGLISSGRELSDAERERARKLLCDTAYATLPHDQYRLVHRAWSGSGEELCAAIRLTFGPDTLVDGP